MTTPQLIKSSSLRSSSARSSTRDPLPEGLGICRRQQPQIDIQHRGRLLLSSTVNRQPAPIFPQNVGIFLCFLLHCGGTRSGQHRALPHLHPDCGSRCCCGKQRRYRSRGHTAQDHPACFHRSSLLSRRIFPLSGRDRLCLPFSVFCSKSPELYRAELPLFKVL